MKPLPLSLLLALALAAVPVGGQQPAAQTQDEVASIFSGAWRVFDPGYTGGGPCTIALSSTPVAEAYRAEQAYCIDGLEGVASWGVERGQLVLLGANRTPIARLGGNADRISGDMSDGRMLILERTEPGDADPEVPACLFSGYGQDCAAEADRAPLARGPDTPAEGETLVRLVLRDQPRPDAPVVSTVEPGVCLAFSECRTASEGPWCRTNHQGATSWARRHAVRLGEFPVLTYRSGC